MVDDREGSLVKRDAMDFWKTQKIITANKNMSMDKMIEILRQDFTILWFPAPRLLPTKLDRAMEKPMGIMQIKELTLNKITTAPNASCPKVPAIRHKI